MFTNWFWNISHTSSNAVLSFVKHTSHHSLVKRKNKQTNKQSKTKNIKFTKLHLCNYNCFPSSFQNINFFGCCGQLVYHISVELSCQCICHSKSFQIPRSTCICQANNILTCRTALSMSQSENITRGDFPPNSNEHFLTLTAQLEEFFQRKKKFIIPTQFKTFFPGTTISPLHPNINMHLLLVIISFILLSWMCDSGVILWGEIRS